MKSQFPVRHYLQKKFFIPFINIHFTYKHNTTTHKNIIC